MARVEKSEGFGFVLTESEHHFLVTISANKKNDVLISEHFTWDDSEAQRDLSFALGQEDNKMRVILPLQKWEAIADPVKAEFNQRLRHLGLKLGLWAVKASKGGQTPISRLFGKELVLLAWANGGDESRLFLFGLSSLGYCYQPLMTKARSQNLPQNHDDG